MEKIYGFVTISFKRSLQYKASIAFRVFSSFIYLFIQIYFWKIIYSNSDNHLVMSYSQMTSYLIISQCVGLLVYNIDYLYLIKNDLRVGTIVNHLVRPYDYMLRYFSESIGKYVSSVLLTVVPMLLICWYSFHIMPPASIQCLFGAIIFSLLSFLINFLMNFILGLSMFWILDMNGLIPIITGCLFQVCSGAILPLAYYPEVIRKILHFLPFRFSADVPFKIYAGDVKNINEILEYVSLLLFWIVTLFVIERVIWKKALKKLCIQGG